MRRLQVLTAAVLLLWLPAAGATENPWVEKVPAAVRRAEAQQTVTALRRGLEITWKADDWQAGLRLAELAERRHAEEAELLGPIARAYWRAGKVRAAERVAERIAPEATDRIALRFRITMHLARGETAAARQWMERLDRQGLETASDYYSVFLVRLHADDFDGVLPILRRAERLIDPAHGYPETHMEEAVDGLAKFFEEVGPAPLNEVVRHGSARIEALVLFNLPACEVFINGKGPYRLVVDTGGSIMVALDERVADEIGLKKIAPATVRGVGGTQPSHQALIDELAIGEIRCRRVMTRTLDLSSALMDAAHGIIGTGVFDRERMTLDFAQGRMTIAESSAAPLPGTDAPVRIVGDAKLMALVELAGDPAVALLDTGADAVALAPSLLERMFPPHRLFKVPMQISLGVGSGTLPEVTLCPGVSLEFAGRRFPEYGGLGLDVIDTILGPVLGIQSDILIGMPAFRDMRTFTVDFPTARMSVEWLTNGE
jgi:predicted aspartyl protease